MAREITASLNTMDTQGDLLGLNPVGIDVCQENSFSFWMVLKWYQSVDSRGAAKHLDITTV